METLQLPFWVVTERESTDPPSTEPCKCYRQPLACSMTNKLTHFLHTGLSGHWKVNLVANDSELLLLVADLHREQSTGLCLDPKPDGSGGTSIPLPDILRKGSKRSAG
jgi:hypothetical protein